MAAPYVDELKSLLDQKITGVPDVNWGGVQSAVNDYNQRDTQIRAQASAQQAIPTATSATAKIAYNPDTGQYAVGGKILPHDYAMYSQIANANPNTLPDQPLPPGWIDQTAQFGKFVQGIQPQSDVIGSGWANFKGALGAGASAVHTLFSDTDPSNAWSRAPETHAADQSLGQQRASGDPWYSSLSGFMTNLAGKSGMVAGNIAAAVPLAIAGGAAGTAAEPGGGTLVGGAGTAAMALTGGVQVAGMTANTVYANTMNALQKMSEQERLTTVPLYAQVKLQTGDSDEAMRQVAITGARAAEMPSFAIGAGTGFLAGRLGAPLLNKIG